MRFRLSLLLLSFALALAPLAHAQVQADLVAAGQSIQPGHPVTIALRLDHEKHWHSYWLNAGTGYPTSITWKLPEGWSASAMQWRVSHGVRDTTGMISGNGYEGVLYLPVTLTPPDSLKAGETITFSAEAKWLMCAEVCVPGKASLELRLPVRADTPLPSPTEGPAISAAFATLPQTIPGLSTTASLNGKTITLRLVSAAGAPLPKLDQPWFFSADETIQFDEPQSVRKGAPGELLIDLPVSPHLNETPTRLTGVLRIEGGSVAGIPIDTALGVAERITSGAAKLPAAAARNWRAP